MGPSWRASGRPGPGWGAAALASGPCSSARCPVLSPSGGPRRLSASRRGGSWSGPGPAPQRSTPLCGAAGSGSPSSATASRTCTPGSKPWPRRLRSTWTSWARWPARGLCSPKPGVCPPHDPCHCQQPQGDLETSNSPSACQRGQVGSGAAAPAPLGRVCHSNYIYYPLAACLLPVLVMTSLWGWIEPQVGTLLLPLVPRCGGPTPGSCRRQRWQTLLGPGPLCPGGGGVASGRAPQAPGPNRPCSGRLLLEREGQKLAVVWTGRRHRWGGSSSCLSPRSRAGACRP